MTLSNNDAINLFATKDLLNAKEEMVDWKTYIQMYYNDKAVRETKVLIKSDRVGGMFFVESEIASKKDSRILAQRFIGGIHKAIHEKNDIGVREL